MCISIPDSPLLLPHARVMDSFYPYVPVTCPQLPLLRSAVTSLSLGVVKSSAVLWLLTGPEWWQPSVRPACVQPPCTVLCEWFGSGLLWVLQSVHVFGFIFGSGPKFTPAEVLCHMTSTFIIETSETTVLPYFILNSCMYVCVCPKYHYHSTTNLNKVYSCHFWLILILIILKQTWIFQSEVVASHLLLFSSSSSSPPNWCSFEVAASPSQCSCSVSACVLTLRFNSVQQSLAEMKGRQVWKALWSVTLKPNGSLGFHANFGLISAISNCKQKKRLMQIGRIWYFCKDLNVCLLARHLRRICVRSIWNCLDDIIMNM